MRVALLITSVLLFLTCTNSVRILAIFPMLSHSHYTIGHTLMKELAKRGHEITFVSLFPEKEKVNNLTSVVLDGIQQKYQESKSSLSPFSLHNIPSFLTIFMLNQMTCQLLEEILEHETMQALLKNKDKQYDIVLSEQFMLDGLLAVGQHFGVPYGLVSAIGPSTWSNHLVGAPDIPSYMGSIITENKVHTSFYTRMVSFIDYGIYKILSHLYFYHKQNDIIQKYVPNSPHIYDIIYNTSLIIYNSDVALSQPLPTAPNMIEIGGFHVLPPKKLPDDLQKLLDNAKNGVIYFSMGSVMKSKLLPLEKRQEILKALSKVKETVLWKFEENLPDLPPNVVIKDWFPQTDLLAHPNVKVFITHGGRLSTIEALYRGVPIVGIPVFGDQTMNMANAVSCGHGVMIPYGDLSEETLTNALKEVLHNPKYSISAKHGSSVLQDQIINPIDKAAYWIEYVVKYKGAKHLRLASVDLAWYQHASLDVILFLGVVDLLLVWVFYKIARRLCCRSKKNKKQKVN